MEFALNTRENWLARLKRHATLPYSHLQERSNKTRLNPTGEKPPELSSRYLKVIASWLTYSISEQDMADRLANLFLYPDAVPTARPSLELVAAVLREEIQANRGEFDDKANAAVVITDDLIRKIPLVSLAVLIVIDALQPTGVMPLVYLKKDKETILGSLVAFESVGESETAARVKVKKGDTQDLLAEIEIPTGEIVLLPGESGTMVLEISSQGAQLDGQRKAVVDVVGGEIGAVIDARGRPLRLPDEVNQRQTVLKGWMEVFL